VKGSVVLPSRVNEKHRSRVMKKPVTVIALAVMVLGISAGLYACHGHAPCNSKNNAERMRQMATWKVDDLLDEFDASPQQRVQANQLKDSLLADAGGFHDSMRAAHKLVATELVSDKPDAAALHTLLDQRIDAARAILHKTLDGALGLQATLTPAQRAKITTKVQQRLEQCEEK
jgi:periplasmic protein CpxP/Spy